MLGELDRAIDLLKTYLKQVGPDAKLFFKNDSDPDPIRTHPRYGKLLELAGWHGGPEGGTDLCHHAIEDIVLGAARASGRRMLGTLEVSSVGLGVQNMHRTRSSRRRSMGPCRIPRRGMAVFCGIGGTNGGFEVLENWERAPSGWGLCWHNLVHHPFFWVRINPPSLR